MTAEELYRKEFGNVDSIPKESVIRLLKHFAKALKIEREQALRIHDVVGQSEQFYCNCSRAKGLDYDDDGMPYCIECQKPVQ